MKKDNLKKRNRVLVSILASLSSMSSLNLVTAHGTYQQGNPVMMQTAPQPIIIQNKPASDNISRVVISEQVAKNQKAERKGGVLGPGDLIFAAANIGGNAIWYKFANTFEEKPFFEYFVNPFKISDNDPTKNETKTLSEWGLDMIPIKATINELTDSDDLYVSYWRKLYKPFYGITTKRSSLVVENNTNDLNKEPDDSRTKIGQPDPMTGKTMQADDDVLISAYCPSRLKTMRFTKMQSEIFKFGFKNYCFSNSSSAPIILALALATGHLISVPIRYVSRAAKRVGNVAADVARLQAAK